MKNENAAHMRGMDIYQQQPRNVNNGRWAARIRVESEVVLDPIPEGVLPLDNGNKPYADIAMLELDPDDARERGDSDNPRIRLAVAANLSTSEEILDELARDDFSFIRALVASNPNASLNTAHFLCGDAVDLVSSTAIDRLGDSRERRLFNHGCIIRWTYF